MTTRTSTKTAVAPAQVQMFVADSAKLSVSTHLPSLHSLALQILHNLQHQHYWTDLKVYTHSPLTKEPLSRPLVSGLPPQRLYVHPDEQVELLKNADRQRKAAEAAGEKSGLEVKAQPEHEWVLPTRLNEQWTLRRLAEVFDDISILPPQTSTTAYEAPANPWRTTKRVVLSTVDTDSTVVYYIVHDGVVKPRQN
ncbi:Sen15 protein-domain-containing protein [Boeremia exigua]|uniref:Sen15 protein-domain-containing protein n=1 Tax=Boeremia exigua TaxID=749465 RepID=UPI001E8EA18E|nr:Sen15 protein-domain-containing protein [Boeremia exigua]KAH6642667.1 Sen15 protein-domain-containing protein [Boeremia exigua]